MKGPPSNLKKTRAAFTEIEHHKQIATHVNTCSFNLLIQIYVQSFQYEIQMNKVLNPRLTTKEMKDLQKKQKSVIFQKDFE